MKAGSGKKEEGNERNLLEMKAVLENTTKGSQ